MILVLFYSLFSFILWKQNLSIDPRMVWNSLWRPSCLWTAGHPSDLASWVLTLQTCIMMPCWCLLYIKEIWEKPQLSRDTQICRRVRMWTQSVTLKVGYNATSLCCCQHNPVIYRTSDSQCFAANTVCCGQIPSPLLAYCSHCLLVSQARTRGILFTMLKLDQKFCAVLISSFLGV